MTRNRGQRRGFCREISGFPRGGASNGATVFSCQRLLADPAWGAVGMQESTIVILIAVGVVVLIGLAFGVSLSSARRKREHKAQLFAEARQFVENIQHCKSLPVAATHLILKSGEVAFYSAACALYETRAVRQFTSGSTGVRIAKGVYIGGTKGYSTSTQEWTQIDNGILTVTNKRLVFDGGKADRAIALAKVLSVNSGLSGVEVSVENRQKSMVFGVPNPLIAAAIIRICSQVDDPQDLSQTTLDITFEE